VDLHIQVYVCYLADQVFEEDHTPYEEPEFSYLIVLSRYILTFFYSCRFLFLYWTQCLFYSFISLLSCVNIYMYCCSDLNYYFITCSGYFRLSVYMWGILLAYIRCRLSSRLRFHVF